MPQVAATEVAPAFTAAKQHLYTMAIDFHELETGAYLFGLDEYTFSCLAHVFDMFYQWTGLRIDPYKSMQLTTENCKVLLQIIDNQVQQADLNKDKRKTRAILGFRGLLEYFVRKNVSFKLHGD
ncbi:hypothetical protein V9K67_05900 [Paraflavisolibacter sp. H34]|uniref:hypothetical protein n=1 Tax=Huijunlia imazamoxiresistens TaxID=3127457 RepID=UPI0030179750